jgi:hypothetical protein
LTKKLSENPAGVTKSPIYRVKNKTPCPDFKKGMGNPAKAVFLGDINGIGNQNIPIPSQNRETP